MKTKLLILTLIILCMLKVEAQCTGNVTIPDANFKNALLALGIDADNNNVISCTEAAAYTGDLRVRNLDIADLTGIEAFVNITFLDCSLNDLTSLNVSTNTLLTTLYCTSNSGITSLDTSNNIALEDLSTLYTNITSLDLSNNTALIELQCSHNSLTSLDLSNNTALTTVYCYNNGMTNINVSGATALEALYCYGNPIKNLDVSTNTALKFLTCNDNELSSLDVSNNTILERLSCYDNELTYLDVAANSVLTRLSCYNNNLVGLNIANGNNINFASNNNFTNNANLNCIQVDDVTYANANMAGFKDVSATYSAICYVNIPDANFKAALVGNTSINTNGDTEISFPEAINYSGQISVSTQSIASLVGIEAFQNITSLNCSYNTLTSLDVSVNTALTFIGCHNNNLTALDVSNNLALTGLRCDSNGITNLDVSGNPVLDYIRCRNNNLIGLSIANGNNTNFGTTTNSVDFRDNDDLTCIEVDDVAYSNTNWASLKETTASYTIICVVNIPDTNFKSILVNNSSINTNGDAEISYAEAGGYTGELDISDRSITDLTGIEAFVNITSLNCDDNSLTTLDVSNNTALEKLDCSSNDLTTLDVAANTALTYLNCARNLLTTLDVTNNTVLTELYFFTNAITSIDISNNAALTYLSAYSNQLTSLDVSNNTALVYLRPNNNQISSLDVSNNILLEYLNCSASGLTSIDVSANTLLTELDCSDNLITSLDLSANTILDDLDCSDTALTSLDISGNRSLNAINCSYNSLVNLNVANGNNTNFINGFFSLNFTNNPNLGCIKVDDVAYSDANWSSRKDDFTTFSATGIVDIPDANFKNSLLNDHSIDLNNDGEISCGEASSYTGTLNLSSKAISDLTGIDSFINLTQLFVNNNNLTSIDITAIGNLTDLSCNNNALTSLIFSDNGELTYLSCNDNNLTSLDISSNYNLTYFSCANNNLVSLNLAMYNHTNLFVNTAFPNYAGNPNLVCIKVYNVAYADANWTALKDATATYNATGNVDFLDINFKNALLNDHTIDLDNDGEISCGEASVYTGIIDVSNKSITDLTGIDSFVNLTQFIASDNAIASIDVSNLTDLTNLTVNDNLLTGLNIDSNLALTTVSCNNNMITSLNITNNTNLMVLSCANNNLTSLNVTNNTALTNLDCNNNEIVNLDISGNTVLTTLYCYDNALTGLNLANGNNTNMLANTSVPNYAGNPDLTCIQVDDETFANSSNWIIIKDATASYSNSCDYSRTLVITTTNGAISTNIQPVNGTYENGTIVELTATPNTGYEFTGWSGDATGTTNPLPVTLDADKSITAIFSVIQQTLNITTTNGTVTANTPTTNGTYDYGTTVELTATPNTGYEFTGWSGDATGTTNPLSVTLDADKSITAMFSEIATASIDDVFEKTVRIYPNPTKGEITINVLDALKSVEVFNISGRKVLETTSTTTNLSSLSQGVYLIKIITVEGNTAVKRIVKK